MHVTRMLASTSLLLSHNPRHEVVAMVVADNCFQNPALGATLRLASVDVVPCLALSGIQCSGNRQGGRGQASYMTNTYSKLNIWGLTG